MILNDKIYNVLKWIDLIFIPAVVTLYCALAAIWGWPYAQAIAGTAAAIETFIGALIGVSSYNNKKAAQIPDSDYIPKYSDKNESK